MQLSCDMHPGSMKGIVETCCVAKKRLLVWLTRTGEAIANCLHQLLMQSRTPWFETNPVMRRDPTFDLRPTDRKQTLTQT